MLTYMPVNSSYVKAIAWDEETETFGAIFHEGSEYHYSRVSETVYKQVRDAESIGTAFDKLIKRGGFVFKKVR